jgi:rhodanese-related sulfurtransferase
MKPHASTAIQHFAHLIALALLSAICAAPAAADAEKISARAAHERAAAGELVLVDVRTPAEWRSTGIGAGAHAVSMHLPGFAEKLAVLTGGDTSRPVALICARGGRSARMSAQLVALGYARVLDVAEGMLGSRHGPGWLKSGLPTAPHPD